MDGEKESASKTCLGGCNFFNCDRQSQAPVTLQSLSATGICKSFEGNSTLQDISFTARAGRVLAICGENGEGKSTLIRILSGAVKPDKGCIFLGDAPVAIDSPRHAIELGIQTVHQELSLVPHINVVENILLGKMPNRFTSWIVDWSGANHAAGAALKASTDGSDEIGNPATGAVAAG